MLVFGVAFLRNAGLASYKIDAEVLLIFSCAVSREFLFLNQDFYPAAVNTELFFNCLSRRSRFEPIAYIIGFQYFWKAHFKVNQSVLIPRPESELLIEAILKYYIDKNAKFIFADFGSGSGCLGASILMEYPNSVCIFVEKSKAAMQLTKLNILKLNLVERSKFFCNSWKKLKIRKKLDFIVSNPPYIQHKTKLMPDVLNFEPHKALFSCGIGCYQEIFLIAKNILKKDGRLFFEIDGDNYRHFKLPKNFKIQEILKDLHGINRCAVIQFCLRAKYLCQILI